MDLLGQQRRGGAHCAESPGPAFAERAPYVIALIDLAEGPRLMMNVINCAPEDVTIGMAVRVTFEKRGDMALPQAEPA